MVLAGPLPHFGPRRSDAVFRKYSEPLTALNGGRCYVHYIGLDAHSKTCTAVVINEKGEIVLNAHFPMTEKYLLSFIKGVQSERISSAQDIRDAYEAKFSELAKQWPVIRRQATIPGISVSISSSPS